MRRAHFPNEQAPRANEGGKREFLRVRRARNLDTLPQKERKPRLKKTIVYFPPPKTAFFGERTLKEATASSAGEGEFSRQSLARLILSRREKRENTSSSKLLRMLGFSSNVGAKSCAQMFSQYNNIIAQDFHSAPIFNGGVVFKQAKNEKADAACAAPALFLFVFRFSLIALKHPTTNPSPRQPRPTWCSNGGKLPYI